MSDDPRGQFEDTPRGLLERSLANLTIGVAASLKGRAERMRDTHQGEYENQIHIPFSGSGTPEWAFTSSDVIFHVPLMAAKSQRMIPFDQPHFHFGGAEFTQPGSGLVIVDAAVVNWNINEFNWYIGATVRIATYAPLASVTNVTFAGIAHCTFEGYGCLPEMQEFA